MTGPVPLFDPVSAHAVLRPQLEAALGRVLDSGCFIGGPEVLNFEQECQQHLNVCHAIATSSGTDALLAILLGLGLGSGDEVITTPLTFVATAEVILRVGATPVFADIDPSSLCLSPESVLPLVSKRTRAVLGVHLFGQPALGDSMAALCEAKGIFYLEDACQAFGARIGQKCAGTLGTAAAFSFFPTKPLGGLGDGGLVVCGDSELAQRVRALGLHGAVGPQRYQWLGGNFRLDALQAAFLRAKLPHVRAGITERAQRAERYSAAFRDYRCVRPPPPPPPGTEHAWALYSVRVPKGRDRLLGALQNEGIEARVYYPQLLPDQPLFQGRCPNTSLPEARRAAGELLTLPLSATMTERAQDRVIEAIRTFCP